ncbi:alanine racemase C-terminal domain-containing protein [Homoserinimonas sp. A447]
MSFSARALHLSAGQSSLLASAALNNAAVNDAAVSNVVQSLETHPPRLDAEVLTVKRVGPGAGVSYGHTYRTTTPTTLALVAIGYGHGLPRKAGNRASVTARGVRMPIVGRVAMDVLVIDAGDASVAAGDRVTFFGDPASAEIPLAEWAESVGEHPFSVLACLDHRVSRVVAT